MPSTQAKSKHAPGINAALFKVLGDPLRHRIMIILTEREASARQLAEMLGESLENTAYHLREMKKVGLIELVREEAGPRGGHLRIYKAVARPVLEVESWEKLPRLLREVQSVFVGQLTMGDIMEAVNAMIASINAGVFDLRPGRAMLRVPMVVDEEGWGEIEEVAARYLQDMLEVEAKSAERIAKSGEDGFKVATSALAFEMPAAN